MKSKIIILMLAATIAATPITANAGNILSRMYNPNTGEHVYTASNKEKEYLDRAGWDEEGAGWIAPDTGKNVYRLYNPNAGDHHYTVSEKEKNYLASIGWRYEGIAWKSGGTVPVYRAYNPNAKTGSHFYTTDNKEIGALTAAGWHFEGVAWYGESAEGTAS